VSQVSQRRIPPGGWLTGRLLTRGAYRWYLGAMFGLVYQVIEIIAVWQDGAPLADQIVATVLLVVFYLAFLAIPPLVWPERHAIKVAVVAGYWLATVALVPYVGVSVLWVWTLIAAMIGFTWLPVATGVALSVALVGVQVVVVVATGFDDTVSFSPIITASVALSMIAFSRQIVANQALRDAQSEIARLAAADERARLARDLHDILGHSLTVVAVKSELAGRLVSLDPGKAAAEIGEVEQLARTALRDLRSSVAEYRAIDLDTELAAARIALSAAGICAHLPHDGSAAREELRVTFGWALREGVTNVIRHSRARACWVAIEHDRLIIRDNGAGVAPGPDGSIAVGSGLRGLSERAREARLSLHAANAVDGGFELVVEAVRV